MNALETAANSKDVGMIKDRPTLSRAFYPLFMLSVLALSITNIEDTDAWLHLSLGREIFNLTGLPSTEPFTFPSMGQPFMYTSWLFGLIVYLSHLAFGYSGIVAFKSLLILGAFHFLWKYASSNERNNLITAAVLGIALLMSRHRFVIRPDMAMMLFLALSIYAFDAFGRGKTRTLYMLPLVYLLWANMHSSVILSFVPCISYVAGAAAERMLIRRKLITAEPLPAPMLWKAVAISLACISSTLINPNFIGQHTFGYEILSTPWYKENIIELNPPILRHKVYLAIWAFAVIASFIPGRSRFSVRSALLVAPFLVLPFWGMRFMFLSYMVGAPVLARNISGLFSRREKALSLMRSPLASLLLVAWMVTYSALSIAAVGPFYDGHKSFGVGVDLSSKPSGAAAYLKHIGFAGRIFPLFQWGSYLIWEGYPGWTVFIESRGVLSEPLLKEYDMVIGRDPSAVDSLYARYGFEAILLDYPRQRYELIAKGLIKLPPGQDISSPGPEWALVYWDDNSLLYLKRGGTYSGIIDRDEYRYIKPANGKNAVSENIYYQESARGMESELRKNMDATGSVIARSLLGYLYNEQKRYDEALQVLGPVEGHGKVTTSLPFALAQLGRARWSLKMLDGAAAAYERAFDISGASGLLLSAGWVRIEQGRYDAAKRLFLRVIELDPNDKDAYKGLMQAYEVSGNNEEAGAVRKQYRKLHPGEDI